MHARTHGLLLLLVLLLRRRWRRRLLLLLLLLLLRQVCPALHAPLQRQLLGSCKGKRIHRHERTQARASLLIVSLPCDWPQCPQCTCNLCAYPKSTSSQT